MKTIKELEDGKIENITLVSKRSETFVRKGKVETRNGRKLLIAFEGSQMLFKGKRLHLNDQKYEFIDSGWTLDTNEQWTRSIENLCFDENTRIK